MAKAQRGHEQSSDSYTLMGLRVLRKKQKGRGGGDEHSTGKDDGKTRSLLIRWAGFWGNEETRTMSGNYKRTGGSQDTRWQE